MTEIDRPFLQAHYSASAFGAGEESPEKGELTGDRPTENSELPVDPAIKPLEEGSNLATLSIQGIATFLESVKGNDFFAKKFGALSDAAATGLNINFKLPVHSAHEARVKMVKTAFKAIGVFLLKCLANLTFIGLFLPLAIIEGGVRLFSANKCSLLAPLILPASMRRRAIPTLKSLNEGMAVDRKATALIRLKLPTSDGKLLEAFHVQCPSPENSDPSLPRQLTVIFCPNAANCRDTDYMRSILNSEIHTNPNPTDYLFVNYRGVGGSSGLAVSLDDLIGDGEAAMKWATEEWNSQEPVALKASLESDPELSSDTSSVATEIESSSSAEKETSPLSQIHLYGQSIGGGVSAAMAKSYPRVHVNLIHTFTSWSDAAEHLTGKVLLPPFAKLLGSIANTIGGSKLSPTRDIAERQATFDRSLSNLPAAELTPLGKLYVEQAMYDTILGAQASLSEKNLPRSDTTTYKMVATDHLNM